MKSPSPLSGGWGGSSAKASRFPQRRFQTRSPFFQALWGFSALLFPPDASNNLKEKRKKKKMDFSWGIKGCFGVP